MCDHPSPIDYDSSICTARAPTVDGSEHVYDEQPPGDPFDPVLDSDGRAAMRVKKYI